jgi:hypothetical protein
MFRHRDAIFREFKYKSSTNTDLSICEVNCQTLRYLKCQNYKPYRMVRSKLHSFWYYGGRYYNDWATGRYAFESRWGRIFFFSPKRPNGLWGPLTFLCKGCRGSFMGTEQLRLEVNLRVVSRVRMSRATRVTPPAPSIYIHGVETENFTVSFYFPVIKVRHKSRRKNHNAGYVTVFTYKTQISCISIWISVYIDIRGCFKWNL